MIVEYDHFRYLSVQKGSLSHLIGRPAIWQERYEEVLEEDFQSIKPYLPKMCRSVLDVGSGLGGIDILFNNYYGDIIVELLDGEDDPPVMHLHSETFNNMTVARDFLKKNGVNHIETWNPTQIEFGKFGRKNDLIVSFGSWCFHYPPETYLDFVYSKCHENTVLILDVRRYKHDYFKTLATKFEMVATLDVKEKSIRAVLKPKANNAGDIIPFRLSGVVA